MFDHDDSTLAYLYGRYDIARRTMKDSTLRPEQRRDWAMRAEELRQCLRQLERWRTDRTGSRYQPDEVTATEIQPPRRVEHAVSTHDGPTRPLHRSWSVRRPQAPGRPG